MDIITKLSFTLFTKKLSNLLPKFGLLTFLNYRNKLVRIFYNKEEYEKIICVVSKSLQKEL